MQVVAVDILEQARGISTGLSGAVLAVGFLVWLLGWRGHRFWIVLASTVAAGTLGLFSGQVHGAQPVLAGLLLAVAAGALALALVRLVAFAAAGAAAWVLVHALVPHWDQPLVCIVVGGLIGLLLFRVWTMVLTSVAGTLLMAYSGLCLADRLGNLDMIDLATRRGLLLNCACGGTAIVGVVAQYFLERRKGAREEPEEYRPKRYQEGRGRGWFGKSPRSYRRAG